MLIQLPLKQPSLKLHLSKRRHLKLPLLSPLLLSTKFNRLINLTTVGTASRRHAEVSIHAWWTFSTSLACVESKQSNCSIELSEWAKFDTFFNWHLLLLWNLFYMKTKACTSSMYSAQKHQPINLFSGNIQQWLPTHKSSWNVYYFYLKNEIEKS